MLPPALSLHGLRKTFGDVVAVDNLDLEVPPGECFGLLGPNGAGKTTTIEICEGLTAPDAGEVLVLGQQWGQGGAALRQRLGISLQETQFSEKLTVAETLQLFRSFYQRPRPLDEVLGAVQLGEKRNGRVGQLSGGQKQRLALACALVADPELFFLDEPTTGLDPQSRRQLWELIEEVKRAGRTVVITTHYMEEAERLCDRVAIVDHGKVIAFGTPRHLIASLGAQHIIEFSVGEDQFPPERSEGSSLTDAELLQLPGALSIRRREDSYLLESAQAHRTIPALLALLGARGLPLAQLRTHSATLEDVFVHLTGRTLRDG
ncbi:MAG TPA: ABC transporter ATP-binding protein [Gemmatimonadales bacterium]|nr:ABC transporter ATP-binding protein [Gemmatimonadales bacterium]